MGVAAGETAVGGMTIRAYSRHRGVSHTAVRKALAAGRITPGSDGKINASQADAQWLNATDLAKHSNSVTGSTRSVRPRESEPPPESAREPDGLEAGAGGEAGTPKVVSSYATSRAARETYLARLAKLEYAQRSAKLIDVDEVRAQVFALTRRIRDNFLGLPDRLSPLLAGQSDPAAIHRALTEDILAVLAETSGPAPIRAMARREP